MVLCPPRLDQQVSRTLCAGLGPDPDLGLDPGFGVDGGLHPDLGHDLGGGPEAPSPGGGRPAPGPRRPATGPCRPATGPCRPARARKRIRAVVAVALTGALALGLTGSSASHPVRVAGQPRRHALGQGTVTPPRGVITQARARQRRRHRNMAATAAAAAGIGAARAAGMGSPPARGRRSRHRHPGPGGSPPPPPRAGQLRGLPAHGLPIIDGLSCPSAGDCALDGTYMTRSNDLRVFVGSEVRGRWGRAMTIAGVPASADATAAPVSCPSAGNCLAAGYYRVGQRGVTRSFVVTESDGTWNGARQIEGLTPGGSGSSGVDAVSCASAGNCAIGGSSSAGVPFVVSESHGRWGRAQPILGLPSAHASPLWSSTVSGISCASAGNCSAAGTYTQALPAGTRVLGVFVASENDGTWGRAEPLRGTLVYPSVTLDVQVSCAAPGNCGLIVSAGLGWVRSPLVGFVASEVRGTWGNPEPVPGIKSRYTIMGGLSCPAPGDCAADGFYDHGHCTHPFTITQADGTWQAARSMPGAARRCALWPTFGPLSCASVGNCLVGGSTGQAATATETDGTWHDARQVPGVTALNGPGSYVSEVDAVSCSPGGPCASAGDYRQSNAATRRLFVVG